MKGLLIILFFGLRFASSQTMLPNTTTVKDLLAMKPGYYMFMSGTDTIIYKSCTPLVLLKHDTVLQKVDSVAIMAQKICPIPIPCPQPIPCPAPLKPRTVVYITEITTSLKKIITITYDDGSQTQL